MPKLLILTDWYSPGFLAGGPIQSCINLANALKDKFDINILTTDTDFQQIKSYPNIVPNEWIIDEGLKIYYAKKKSLPKLFPSKFLKLEFDVVYLNNMYSWHFTLLPLLLKRMNLTHKANFILAPRGMLSEGSIQVKKIKKLVFLKTVKMLGIYDNITFHATSEDEKRNILTYFPEAIVKTISNLSSQSDTINNTTKKENDLKLICVSRTSPEKNIYFLIELLTKLPIDYSLSLDIYGLINDKEYFKKCKELEHKLPKGIQVNYCKPLPHTELLKKFNSYHFFISPSKGENFGHAIAEALSAGMPVIISDRTPWRNLKVMDVGWDISLERPDEFLKILNFVYAMDNVTYQNMKIAAIEFYSRKTDNKENINSYVQLFTI